MSSCSIESPDYCVEKWQEQSTEAPLDVPCFECNQIILKHEECTELFYYVDEDKGYVEEETSTTFVCGYICKDCSNAIKVFGMSYYGEFWDELYNTINNCKGNVELEKLDKLTAINKTKVAELIDDVLEDLDG